jgi:hypothetical protein
MSKDGLNEQKYMSEYLISMFDVSHFWKLKYIVYNFSNFQVPNLCLHMRYEYHLSDLLWLLKQ